MKSILDELYDYGLFHLTEIADDNGEYKMAMDRLLKAETELLKALLERKELLDEYPDAEIDLTNLSNRYEFIQGFRVGAQLVLKMLKPIK